MPSMTFADLEAKRFSVELIPPPITEVESSTGWTMSYYTARVPQELFTANIGLSGYEAKKLNMLPKGLVQAFAAESDDPEVVDYLRGALMSENPYETIINDFTDAIYLDMLESGTLGDLDDLGFLKKIKKVVKKVRDVHKKVQSKILPKSVLKAKEKVKDFRKRVHQKVRKAGKKVWKKYGNVIIGVAGAVLAPFTGGASLAAAAVLTTANTMYQTKRNADAAKKMAKKEAAALNAEAVKQEAEVAKQVNDFYEQNKDWFYQYGMTDAEWAKLTLDQKISFINAGAEGKFPPAGSTMPPQAANTVAPTSSDIAPSAPGAPPGTSAPGAPSLPAPSYPSYSGGGGGGGGGDAVYGPPPAAPGAPGQEGQPVAEVYDVVIEGQKAGSFGTLDEASAFIMANTTPGDRFEVFLNGQSTGLNIRTGQGAVEVPPEAAAQMRSLSKEEARAVVEKAESEQAAVPEKKGGFPWWLLLAGGAAVAVASAS